MGSVASSFIKQKEVKVPKDLMVMEDSDLEPIEVPDVKYDSKYIKEADPTKMPKPRYSKSNKR